MILLSGLLFLSMDSWLPEIPGPVPFISSNRQVIVKIDFMHLIGTVLPGVEKRQNSNWRNSSTGSYQIPVPDRSIW